MKVSLLESEIRSNLESAGWTVFQSGLPDLLCIKDSSVMFVEVKSMTDSLKDSVASVRDRLALFGRVANVGILKRRFFSLLAVGDSRHIRYLRGFLHEFGSIGVAILWLGVAIALLLGANWQQLGLTRTDFEAIGSLTIYGALSGGLFFLLSIIFGAELQDCDCTKDESYGDE